MIRSSASRFCLFGFLVVGAVLPGCYLPGGSGFSTDTHTYVSTAWQPYTVTLKDTRTGQNIWSIDVPVGKQLVVQFKKDEGIKGSPTPDLMKWKIMDAGDTTGDLDNSIPVPGVGRRLDPTLRSTPELPEAMGGGVPKEPAPAGAKPQ